MGKNNKTSKSNFLKELEVLPIHESYVGSFKLKDKVALITGADSGIGRSVAVHFAREGASVVISYLKNDDDAENTKLMVEAEGQKCLLIKGDISSHSFCKQIVRRVSKQFSTIDILVNNAGMHVEQLELTGIDKKQLIRTFEVNIFSFFYLTKEMLNIMPDGSSIINTSSVTAFRGSEHLIDYAATKAAIIAFTRSMSKNLVNRKIRVNAVAPGPIWTPLVIDSFSSEGLRGFGKDTLMGRAGYPYEVAPAYVYLASKDSSYVTGQVIHINGGDVVSG